MLKIIYGKAGSGKTTTCFEMVKKIMSEGRNALFIVPESYSLAMEKRIVQEFGAGFSPEIDVLTFERLPSQIFSRFGPVGVKNYDKMARQMILQKILLQNQKRLNIFARSVDLTDFAKNLLTLFDEFERYLITPEILEENMPDSTVGRLKFFDILLIYREYIKNAKNSDVNLVDRLDFLAENGIYPFENTTIFLDQFTSFTPSEYEIIRRFLRYADVIGTFTSDGLEKKNGLDIFAESKMTIEKLFEIAYEDNVKVEPNTYLKNERKLADEDVTIFTSSNPYEEVKFAAEEIRKLVLDKGVSQNEIAIIANNSSLYGGLAAQIFPKFGIDIFIDDAKSALLDARIQGVISFLDVYVHNFSSHYILKFLKSYLADIDKNDLDLLENYVLAAGVNASQWMDEGKIKFVPRGWNESQISDVRDILSEQMEIFKKLKPQGRKKVKDIAEIVRKFLDISAVEIPCQARNDELEIVYDIIEQMEDIFGDNYITFEKFVSIFKAGLATCELTALPKTKGQAHFCGIDRYKGHNPKVLFILGCNEGEFPKRHIAEGIISDGERQALGERGIILADTARVKQIYEQQTVYFCTHSPSEKLYLSYSVNGFDGKDLAASPVISQYPTANLRDNIYGVIPKKEKIYDNLPSSSISEVVKKIYENKNSTSVSQIERFSGCPYSYFMRYGIDAKKRQTNAIGVPDAGTIIHICIEKFCKNMADGFEIIPQLVEETVEEIFSENIREKPRFKAIKSKIISTLEIALKAIIGFYNDSPFEPLGFEMDLPELEIKLKNGRVMKLVGRADRVDIARTADGNYINLVDYKTYAENLDEIDMAAGVQIQLPIYIKAICDSLAKKENMTYFPANMLYFYVNNPTSDIEENWDEILKEMRMRGLILQQNGAPDTPFKYAVFSNTSRASLEQIRKVCENAFEKMQNQLNRLMNGEITLMPYKHGDKKCACEFCDYREICRFDVRKEGNNYNYGKRLDK